MRLSIITVLALTATTSTLAQEPPAPTPVEAPAPVDSAPAPPPADPALEGVATEAPTEPVAETQGTGTVTGVVTDPGGVPYPGLTILVGETSITTDADGRFTVEMEPGDYLITVQEPGLFVPGDLVASVSAASVTTVDVQLLSENPEDYTIIVYAPEVIGGVNASIDQRKDAPAVTEVIGAEQMSKSGDSNAQAALARVTGLTIVDGRFVFVRGLGDRYSSTLLNFSSLPSPEPERRVIPLDLFPTGLLEQVTVYKTWSPDLPGEFGGGVVSVKTRGIPERPFNQVTITGGYTSQTTFSSSTTGYRGPTDFLGFGKGPRAVPTELAEATANEPLVPADRFGDDGFTPEELEVIGESIRPARWGQNQAVVPPDFGIQLGFGRRLDLGPSRLGVYAGVTFNNSWSYDTYNLKFLDAALQLQNDYDFEELQNQITLGAIGNIGLEVNDNHGLYYTAFLSRSSTYTDRTFEGFNNDFDGTIRVTRLDWVERQLFFQQLRGEHTFPGLANVKIDWRYALSVANRDQPDQREFRYDLEPSTNEFVISNRPEGNNVIYSTLSDVNHDARLDVSLPIGSDARPGRVAAGGQVVFRERDVSTRRFSFFESGDFNPELKTLPPEQLFSAPNIKPDGGWQIKEVTLNTDSYFADQQIAAGYFQVDFPFDTIAHQTKGLRDLSILAGVRIEHNDQNVTTFQPFAPDLVPLVGSISGTEILPAVTVTQALLPPREDPNDDEMQLRFGYARTVSRPDFRELSAATFYEVTGGREVVGNPDLESATIDHADFRWEWYPRQGELLSLAAFFKQFTDPIETVVLPSAQLSLTWQNAAAATNMGLEADLRKTLFGIGVPFFDRLYVSANGSLIRSQIDLAGATGVQTNSERPLQGQSPWVVNAQLGYDNTDTKTICTVSFNMAGPRIVEVGAVGAPDVLEEPVPRMDVLFQQGFARDWLVRLRGRNLLDPKVQITQGGEPVRSGKEGWQALVSLEWRP